MRLQKRSLQENWLPITSKRIFVAQAPQGARGAGTADYRIVYKGKTLELKNVTGALSFDSITATISHAQGENVMVIVRGRMNA